METATLRKSVETVWDGEILPALQNYIRIPNRSPMFDPKWRENGHMDKAAKLIADWCRARPIAGLTLEVVQLQDRTPVILMEVPGTIDDTVLLYGHLDKQPEMTGWADGLGPWTPVMRDGKLYGRGGADDGYAAFASLTAIQALKEQVGDRHARFVVLIEACEESGSFDLPAYVEHLKPLIGTPSLIVCLDSGCGNYNQLWCTTSLRGLLSGDLKVEILNEGVHSGDASGIVPSSFRILRMVLSRLEDEKTGRVKPAAFHVDIPSDRKAQAKIVAKALKTDVWRKFPFAGKAGPISKNLPELILNRTWRPALSITGAEGLPALGEAGNVLRPKTSVKVSLRLPPTGDAKKATKALKKLLEADPPYGAKVSFSGDKASPGWSAPALAPWLEASLQKASKAHFRKPACFMGEGGSIPFMAMLGEKFPGAQFMITGVLGPNSNAHGPNEFLHIDCAKKLTCCVASVLEDHAAQAGTTSNGARRRR